MKKTIGSYEAKTNLSSLLEQVAKGESFTITKRGRPVALLSPAGDSHHEPLNVTVEKIRALRKSFRLGGVSVKKLISHGRK